MDNYTYASPARAEDENLVVIDDPLSHSPLSATNSSLSKVLNRHPTSPRRAPIISPRQRRRPPPRSPGPPPRHVSSEPDSSFSPRRRPSSQRRRLSNASSAELLDDIGNGHWSGFSPHAPSIWRVGGGSKVQTLYVCQYFHGPSGHCKISTPQTKKGRDFTGRKLHHPHPSKKGPPQHVEYRRRQGPAPPPTPPPPNLMLRNGSTAWTSMRSHGRTVVIGVTTPDHRSPVSENEVLQTHL